MKKNHSISSDKKKSTNNESDIQNIVIDDKLDEGSPFLSPTFLDSILSSHYSRHYPSNSYPTHTHSKDQYIHGGNPHTRGGIHNSLISLKEEGEKLKPLMDDFLNSKSDSEDGEFDDDENGIIADNAMYYRDVYRELLNRGGGNNNNNNKNGNSKDDEKNLIEISRMALKAVQDGSNVFNLMKK